MSEAQRRRPFDKLQRRVLYHWTVFCPNLYFYHVILSVANNGNCSHAVVTYDLNEVNLRNVAKILEFSRLG